MKNLFFDLEFATSKGTHKICEFGYVLTNENFEVLKKGNFIIDPYINRRDWDWYAAKNILTRNVSEYEKQPKFDEYYDEIKELIENSDYVFGHTIAGDVNALNDDCKRYNLSSIDFDFYDIKIFFKEYENTKRHISVTEILERLGIKGDSRFHDAEADAYNTMLEFKKMSDSLDASVEDMIELCPKAKDSNHNYKITSMEQRTIKREEKHHDYTKDPGNNRMGKWSKANKLFLQFLDNVTVTKVCEKKLEGLKYSISLNYELDHYKQMLNIVQILTNLGAEYVLKASTADIFVTYDMLDENGNTKYCSKSKFVKEANDNGANIAVISFEEFLKQIELTEEELDNLPLVSFDCLLKENAIIKDRKACNRILIKNEDPKDDFNPTIGEMFGDLLKNGRVLMNS